MVNRLNDCSAIIVVGKKKLDVVEYNVRANDNYSAPCGNAENETHMMSDADYIFCFAAVVSRTRQVA